MILTPHILAALTASLPTVFAQYGSASISASASASVSTSCSSLLTAKYATPSVAVGYSAILVAQNLTKPRSIHFAPSGKLLVVESGLGITSYDISGSGSCLRAGNKSIVISDTSLNHGIELSSNSSSSWLYASSSNSLYRWAFDAASTSNTSSPETLVTNMSGDDHTTRTLLLSKKVPGYIIVSRGSTSNLDYESASIDSGHSQVKAFPIDAGQSYPLNFVSSGTLLGWGLRNEVGLDEHPGTGNIYGVENSADQITRNGKDIHEDNPGEELNFLGNLNNASSYSSSGRNFGYPECFSAWSPSVIPDFNGTVGQQFVIGSTNATNNDTMCLSRISPRLTFQAHMAPLDILFNPNGTVAWITFHGSWNRDDPTGYKLSMVEFDASTGAPTQPSTSTTAAIDIMINANNSACPDGCFRPVGLAWDSQGRLFMSSDATGEIYAIVRSSSSGNTSTAGTNATGTVGLPSTNTTTGTQASSSTGAAVAGTASMSMLATVCAALAFLV